MPKFFLKRKRKIFIIRPDRTIVVPNQQGIPVAISEAGKSFTVENGYINTDDPEIIERLRRDPEYGTAELREMTVEDEKAILIKKKYDKLAQTEIEKDRQERESRESLKV